MQGVENVGISKLPDQVLSAVLKQAERLHCCAVVSQTWRTAACVYTNSIIALGPPNTYDGHNGLAKEKCTALSRWLSAHDAAAAVDSMVVAGPEFVDQFAVFTCLCSS
jgi:hypothetical protein